MRFKLSVVATTFTAVVITGTLLTGNVQAQQVDNTETLPDAKAGECYAKVITPAKFTTQSETIVLQEASERIQTIPAKYETVEQSQLVKEASSRLTTVPATYEDSVERVEIAPASTSWTTKSGNKPVPASPTALDAITRSGVDLDAVLPGACFREYFTPAEFKSASQQVLVAEGSEKITIIPAQFETVEERVVVKEASSQVVDVPATYKTEKQQVLVEPAKSVWKQGRGLVERIDNTTGEIMCLVEIPARYETITKTVLDKPATTKRIEVPAVYKTVKVQRVVKPASEQRVVIPPEFKTITTTVKVADPGFYWLAKGEKPAIGAQYSGNEVCLVKTDARFVNVKTRILKTPASIKSVEIPAQFSTIRVNRLVSPATERRIPVAEKTKVISKRIQISPERLEWRKVLCETNMNPTLITDIQRALKRAGFDPGPIDGVLGSDTNKAIEAYQIQKNLDRGGLTYETLKSLNVDA